MLKTNLFCSVRCWKLTRCWTNSVAVGCLVLKIRLAIQRVSSRQCPCESSSFQMNMGRYLRNRCMYVCSQCWPIKSVLEVVQAGVWLSFSAGKWKWTDVEGWCDLLYTFSIKSRVRLCMFRVNWVYLSQMVAVVTHLSMVAFDIVLCISIVACSSWLNGCHQQLH
jgi:hypothetical protein